MDELFSSEAWQKLWTYRATFLTGFGNTLRTAAAALLLALFLGFLFGLMAASGKPILRAIARVYVECIQNTPVVLQMCFLYYVLAFSGVKTDIIATGIVSLGVYTGQASALFPRGSLRRLKARASATFPPCGALFCPRASKSSCRPWSTRW